MKVKEGEEGNLLIFKDMPLLIIISMGSSQRDLYSDMVVDRFIFKNDQITLFPSVQPSYPK